MKFSNKTVSELKEIAKEKGLKGYSKLTKDNLIELIRSKPKKNVKKGGRAVGSNEMEILFLVFKGNDQRTGIPLHEIIPLNISFSTFMGYPSVKDQLTNIKRTTVPDNYLFMYFFENLCKNLDLNKGTGIFELPDYSNFKLKYDINTKTGYFRDDIKNLKELKTRIDNYRKTNVIFVAIDEIVYLINYGLPGELMYNKYLKQVDPVLRTMNVHRKGGRLISTIDVPTKKFFKPTAYNSEPYETNIIFINEYVKDLNNPKYFDSFNKYKSNKNSSQNISDKKEKLTAERKIIASQRLIDISNEQYCTDYHPIIPGTMFSSAKENNYYNCRAKRLTSDIICKNVTNTDNVCSEAIRRETVKKVKLMTINNELKKLNSVKVGGEPNKINTKKKALVTKICFYVLSNDGDISKNRILPMTIIHNPIDLSYYNDESSKFMYDIYVNHGKYLMSMKNKNYNNSNHNNYNSNDNYNKDFNYKYGDYLFYNFYYDYDLDENEKNSSIIFKDMEETRKIIDTFQDKKDVTLLFTMNDDVKDILCLDESCLAKKLSMLFKKMQNNTTEINITNMFNESRLIEELFQGGVFINLRDYVNNKFKKLVNNYNKNNNSIVNTNEGNTNVEECDSDDDDYNVCVPKGNKKFRKKRE